MEQQLLVEAEIVTPGMQAPDPGDSYAISITRYQVLNVLQGIYPHSVILVGHALADMNSPQFAVGVRHHLSLTKEFPEHSNQLNLFVEEALEIGVYFCLSFEVLP